MKRLLMILLTLLLCVPACAEEQTTVLGHMPDGEYIHQYIAPNGQLLWFTAMEENPYIKLEDVNFDGAQDIVVFTFRGANNSYSMFFVYNAHADVYTLATHPGDENGICNYVLIRHWGWWNPRPTTAARARSTSTASTAGKGRSLIASARR